VLFVKKLSLVVVEPPLAFGNRQVVLIRDRCFNVKEISPFSCPDSP